MPAAVCAGIREAFAREVRPFTGPLLRQLTSRSEVHRRSADGWVVNPVVNPHTLTGFPTFCQAEVSVMRACPLVDVVAELLGAPPALLQSAYYESSAGTLTHVDVNPLDADQPMLGAWIALEDIGPGAGRFRLAPGSHRLPDGPRTRRFEALARAGYREQFVQLAQGPVQDEMQALADALIAAHGLRWEAPALRAGDVLFWTNRLLHGSEIPTPGGGSRSSLLLHFVPAEGVTDVRRGS